RRHRQEGQFPARPRSPGDGQSWSIIEKTRPGRPTGIAVARAPRMHYPRAAHPRPLLGADMAAGAPGLTFLAGYLVGGVPFGYLVARWRGVDIFRQGSGNIGATNVGRVLGRRFGLLVFLLDFAKGALPALAAPHLAPATDLGPELPGVVAG